MSKGILGVKKDQKNQMLFFFGKRNDDQWPSDSDDSDYMPSDCSDEGKKSSKRSSLKRSRSNKGKEVAKKRPKPESQGKRLSLAKPVSSKIGEKAAIVKKSSKRFNRIIDSDSTDEEVQSIVSQPGSSRTGDIWGQLLPELVLFQIFKEVVADEGALPFLKSVSRVCRLWNHVSKNSTLWTNIDLSFGWIKKSEATLRRLCDTRLTRAVEINFSGWKCLNDQGLRLVVDNCPKLSVLNLDGCRLTGSGLNYLTDNCRNLCDIQLTQIRDTVGAKSVKYLLEKRANDLISLSITDSPLRSGTELLKHIMVCSRLERLSLCSLQYSSEPIVLPIERLQAGCPRLKCLELVGCGYSSPTLSAVQQVPSPGFSELEELNLGVAPDSSQQSVLTSDSRNNFLHRLLKTSRNLKVIDLRGRGSITCNSLPHLPVTDLQRLHLSNSSVAKYEGLDIMMKKWKHSLTELDLAWNVYDDESFKRAMAQLSDTSSESNLRILDLRGTQVNCKEVKMLLRGCSNLESLKLESCRCLPRGMKRNYLRSEMAQLRRDINEYISQEK